MAIARSHYARQIWSPLIGDRTDILAVKAAILGGMSEIDVSTEFFAPWCRYHKAFDRFRELHRPAEERARGIPHIIVCYGPTGSGKTEWVKENFPGAYWLSDPTGKWWPGYFGQDTVVLDEFSGKLDYRTLLRMLDSTELRVESKGSSALLRTSTFVFTSNINPDRWYRHQVHLSRRLQEWAHVLEFGQPIEGRAILATYRVPRPRAERLTFGNVPSYIGPSTLLEQHAVPNGIAPTTPPTRGSDEATSGTPCCLES